MEWIEKSLEIDRPLRAVYNQWTQFEEFPRFMAGVKAIKQLDATHVQWRAEVWGREKEWVAQITEQVPDERIAWRSISGDAPNAGIVRFEQLSSNSTRVRFAMEYEPHGLMENVGDALGAMSTRVQSSLEAFKTFIEARNGDGGGWRGEVLGAAESPIVAARTVIGDHRLR